MDHLTAEKIETIQTETEKREQSVRFWKCSKYVAKTWFESRTANITLFADFYRDTIFSCLNYKRATFDEIFGFVLLAAGICTKKLLFLKFKKCISQAAFAMSEDVLCRGALPEGRRGQGLPPNWSDIQSKHLSQMTNGQTKRETDKQKYRQTEIQTNRNTD